MNKALALKLFELQKRLKPIVKDAPSYFKDRKYFDVNTLIAEIKPHLEELKLIIHQPLTELGGKAAICTTIIDSETGEAVSSITPLPESADAQKAGGVITYYRRYTLVSQLMIEGDEDDDSGGTDNKAPSKINPQKKSDYESAVLDISKVDKTKEDDVVSMREKINNFLSFTPSQKLALLDMLK